MGRIPLITGSALQIPDAQLTASDYAGANLEPSMARLSSRYSWAAHIINMQAWIQADFGMNV